MELCLQRGKVQGERRTNLDLTNRPKERIQLLSETEQGRLHIIKNGHRIQETQVVLMPDGAFMGLGDLTTI